MVTTIDERRRSVGPDNAAVPSGCGDTGRGSRAGPGGHRHRRPDQRARGAEEGGPALERPVPLPHREDALVQRQRRGGLLLLLRLPGVGRRHHLRARHGPPRLRRRRALPGRPGRDHAARGRRGGTRPQAALRAARRHGARRHLVPRAPALRARRRPGARLPALARLRRRRRAPVPPRLGARRLGRAGEGAQAAREGAVGLGPRLRQPTRPAAGLLPRPASCSRSATPRAGPSRWADASCRHDPGRHRRSGPSRSTRTHRSRRSTRSAARSTRSTGRSTASSRRARSSCARATPTSSGASRPACRGRWRRAGPRWPKSTSRCCATSPSASCSPTTPTRPGRARRRASTSGSASTRSTSWWPTCPGGSDPGDLARTDPGALATRDPRGAALPPVPRRPHARDGQPLDGRGPGPGGRGRADGGGRAPRRPRARPVRHAAGGPLPGRRGQAPRAPRISPRAPAGRGRDGAPPASGARRGAAADRSTPRTTATASGPTTGRATSAASTALRPGPGLEALKLAVHRPDDVADRVHAVLFADPVQRQAFVALLENDSVHEAVETASPEVANVLRRVIVEEPMSGDPELGDPVDSVVAVLLHAATRRALAEIEVESRAGRRRVAVASGRDRTSAPLAGPTGRSGRRTRCRRPVGSVGWPKGIEGISTWAGEGERRVCNRDRRRESGSAAVSDASPHASLSDSTSSSDVSSDTVSSPDASVTPIAAARSRPVSRARLRSGARRRPREGTADASGADRGTAHRRAHARGAHDADRPRHRGRRGARRRRGRGPHRRGGAAQGAASGDLARTGAPAAAPGRALAGSPTASGPAPASPAAAPRTRSTPI